MSHATLSPPWERTLHDSGEDVHLMMQTYDTVLRPYLDVVDTEGPVQDITVMEQTFRRFSTPEASDMSIVLILRGHTWIVSGPFEGETSCSSSLENMYRALKKKGIDDYIPVNMSDNLLQGMEYKPQYFPLLAERAMRELVRCGIARFDPVIASLQRMTDVVEGAVRFPRYASTRD